MTVFREERLPPGRSVSVPALRRLAPLLEEVGDSMSPFQRPTGDGRAIALQADVETVSVGLVATVAVFAAILDRPEWELRQSDEGRFGTHLIERLGGAGASTASQPSVRTVLHRASRATRATPISALIERALGDRGEWPGPLSRQSPRDYATSIVHWLIARGLLRPALRVRCPHCATDVDMRSDELASELQCGLCGADFALGLALALGGPSTPWVYQLAANIPPERLRSALPVMAALAVLCSHRAGTSAALPHVLGLEVRAPGWSCELDIAAAVIDGPTTLVVVGEVKGGSDPIDANDLVNLARVHDHLRASGVEALMFAATTRKSLTPDERVALRALCDRAPERLLTGGASVLSLPLVLIGRDLSSPWMSDEHPWRWGQPGEPPLAGMALESCKRNLGLADIRYVRVSDGFALRPQWADIEQEGEPTLRDEP